MDTDDGRSVLPENNNHDHHHSDKAAVGSGLVNKSGGWTSIQRNFLGGAKAGSSSEGVIKTVNVAEVGKRLLRIQDVAKNLMYLNASSKQPILNGFNFSGKNNGPKAWIALENRFDELTTKTGGLLPSSSFGKCIGMNKDSDKFAEDLFKSLCQRRGITSDPINKTLFQEFWEEISNQSFDSRLQIYLAMIDKDNDGRITDKEIMEIIKASASANKLPTIEKDAEKYAAFIKEKLDPEKRGYIMIDKLEKLLKDAATHNDIGETHDSSESSRQQFKLTHFLHDNWKRCWVVVLWIGIMVGLFTWKYIQYKHRAVYDVLGPCVCIAKGAAETLKLNMAIMLLPVCRNTITWLRNKTKLGAVVPFDDNIYFHQVIAVAIAIGVGLHAISHLACDFPRLIHATEEEYKPMQQFFGDQAEDYWHFVKEVEGYTGIIMAVLMIIAFTLAWLRKGLKLPSLTRFNAFKNSKSYDFIVKKLTGPIAAINKLTGFNVFWYSHHLFVIVYAMLIVHGIKLYLTKEWYKKTTWMYLAVPTLLYACERLKRTFQYPARILKVAAYPGHEGVLALRMTKPDNFNYKSGEYMFVKCAAVSPFEWHPFSITSAPSDDYLSVHIRALGDWTKKINKIYSEACLPDEGSGIRKADFPEQIPNNLRDLNIDGPNGAPAQDYKDYEVVLLVGLGIGATPMISIVKDIVNNIKANKEENALEDGTISQKNKLSPTREHEFKTKRAYFYWSTKEQNTLGWFKDVMDEVAEIGRNDVIEIHNYCTSVYEEADARSSLITMLQSLYYAEKGVDIVSGTRVKTHFARPNWRKVYTRIADNHKGSRIGVFYCGSPVVIKELKDLASEFSDSSTSTTFEFHKENF